MPSFGTCPPSVSVPPEVLLPKIEQTALSAEEPHITIPTRQASYPTLLEAIVCSSRDAITTQNLDSIVTSWNPAAIAIFGYQPEEMIGQSILRLIPEQLYREQEEVIRRVKLDEQIADFETMRLTRGGEEIRVSLTICPLKDDAGQIVGASEVARNITHLTQLDRARLQLAAIVESSDDAIISKNLDGTITSWNDAAARLFGYTEEEIVGRSILTLIPPELQYEEPGILAKLVAGERIDHFETLRQKRNGERIDVSVTISPIRDASGKVIGASKILRDISERRRLQQSLLQAEKLAATGRMAATIAHEINNPLEGLLNLIYLARTNPETPTEVRSLLEAAEGELGRVSHIARQTLGYYRENVSSARISLAEVVEDVLRVYEPRMNSTNIRVHRNFSEMPKLLLKRGEMMQVISNLIANSMHAMHSGGDLTLTLRKAASKGRQVCLDVSDTGTGIAAQDMKRIFEPFFTTRSSIGTGIGLWVAQQFVEGHGGTIQVTSSTDPASHGTTMSICLPVRDTSEQIQ
jgi:PAS domain S-box-containing protein